MINEAVFEGLYTPGAQPFPPTSLYHVKQEVPSRDVEKAKALLKRGVASPIEAMTRVIE